MNRGAAAVGAALAFAALAGCSALLDTASLQGGVAPVDDAGADDAGDAGTTSRPCTSDLDCEDGEPCTLDACDTSAGRCKPSAPWTGLALDPVVATEKLVFEAADIGRPTVTQDDAAFYLAAWYRGAGGTTDARVRRSDHGAKLSPIDADLRTALGVAGIAATPGMFAADGGLALLGAVQPTSGAATEMRVVALVASTLTPTGTPTKLAVPPHDGDAHRVATSIVSRGLGDFVAMWVSQGDLWTADRGGVTHPAAARGVVGFAPIVGKIDQPYGALLERDASPSPATQLWSQNGGAGLSTLDGDGSGVRAGVAATPLGAPGDAELTVLGWAYGDQTLRFAAASCSAVAGRCLASAALGAPGTSASGVDPALSAITPKNRPLDRDVAESWVVASQDPNDATKTVDSVFGMVFRLHFAALGDDAGAPKTVEVNPPAVRLATSAHLGTSSRPGSTLSTPVVAIAPSGDVLFAWVRHETDKARLVESRHKLVTCGP